MIHDIAVDEFDYIIECCTVSPSKKEKRATLQPIIRILSDLDFYIYSILDQITPTLYATFPFCLSVFVIKKFLSDHFSTSSITIIGALQPSTICHSSHPSGTMPKMPCRMGV